MALKEKIGHYFWFRVCDKEFEMAVGHSSIKPHQSLHSYFGD
jgi:hypothetical protein